MIFFCSLIGSFSIFSVSSLVTPVTECATTSIKRVSAETSNAFAIATKVSNFVTFKPLSITLTCVGLKFTNAASSSYVRFFASRADLIRCPTAFKSIVTPPPERIIVLDLVYLWMSSIYRIAKPSSNSIELYFKIFFAFS